MSNNFNPLDYSVLFSSPRRLTGFSAWQEHIPFAMFLVDLLRPNVFVELGTQYGDSYCAFCQAVDELSLGTRCYSVDTWEGDAQTGFYGPEILADLRMHHAPIYGKFSSLIKSTFDDALKHFLDGSIDLLHIDGYHTYEVVRHDFEWWLPKMSPRGIVVFHDTNVREKDFGVWKFWEKIKEQHARFEFVHGHGLGVLAVGKEFPERARVIFDASPEDIVKIRNVFFQLGQWIASKAEHVGQHAPEPERFAQEAAQLQGTVRDQQLALAEKDQHLTQLMAERERFAQEAAQLQGTVRDQQLALAEKDQHLTQLMAERHRLTQKVAQLQRTVQTQEESISEKEREIYELHHSESYRIGLFCLWPVRTLKHLLLVRGRAKPQGQMKDHLSPEPRDASSVRSSIDAVLTERFKVLQPLKLYSTPDSASRVNLVTDSVNYGSLFGGVATSIIFSALLAEKKSAKLRVITRTERADQQNVRQVLECNGIKWAKNIDFVFAHFGDEHAEVDVGDRDVFVSTSWWTTTSVIKSIAEDRVFYLLQEDERMFYPYGDDHLRCTELLKNPKLRFIINSHLLYNHFVESGFDNIKDRGFCFEPSFDKRVFFREVRPPGSKKNFFFYARPNNLRNLFYRGLEAIDQAVFRGILDPQRWEFYFVGKDIPDLRLGDSSEPRRITNLSWEEYGILVRSMDLGLCLMYTPHPSYPPLDLAASGAVVVTNRFGQKRDLDTYSKNIICRDLDVESMVDGIADAVKLVTNDTQRETNFQNSAFLRDWRTSFGPVLCRLD